MVLAFQPILRLYRLSALWGISCRRSRRLYGVYARFRLSTCAGTGGHVEGPGASQYLILCSGILMTDVKPTPANAAPAKDTGTRIFPWPLFSLRRAIAARSWPSMISSGPPTTSPTLRCSRRRKNSPSSTVWRRRAWRYRRVAGGSARRSPSAISRPNTRRISLNAFRLDVTKLRYKRLGRPDRVLQLSAMPVGRFVLDVHGESRSIWPVRLDLRGAADHQSSPGLRGRLSRSRPGLYSAGCAERERHRCGSARRRAGEPGAARSPAQADRAHRTAAFRQRRLCRRDQRQAARLEVSVINTLAHRLTRILMARDPLSQRVHLSKPAVIGLTLLACCAAPRAGWAASRPPHQKSREERE